MKKFVLLLLVFAVLGFDTQKERAYDVGEWFKFRVHYGLINAGYATLEVQEAVIKNKKVYHCIGQGHTTGMSRFFFRVDDVYESYLDKETGNPIQFVRKIYEGGYERNEDYFFNQASNKVVVKDNREGKESTYVTSNNIQDLISTFYYLRNHPTVDKLKIGDAIAVDMFLDGETIKFKLKFVGREDVVTKFGVVPAMIFKPLVQSGRIFKEQEAVTVWISNDDNKIPLRIQADLSVGSLKADLDGFKGLKYSFKVKSK